MNSKNNNNLYLGKNCKPNLSNLNETVIIKKPYLAGSILSIKGKNCFNQTGAYVVDNKKSGNLLSLSPITTNSNNRKSLLSKFVKSEIVSSRTTDLPIFLNDYLTISRRRSSWNPITSGFTHTVTPYSTIMDSNSINMSLKNAISFLKSSPKWRPYTIVFLGSNPNVADLAKVAAYKTNQSSVSGRWLAGLITNWNAAKHHLFEFVKLNNKILSIYKQLSIDFNKVELPQDSKYIKLEKDFEVKFKKWGGLLNLSSRPVLLVVLDVDSNLSAVNEAQRCGIPVIGLVHTHMDPSIVSYPIPCNTDSSAAVCTVINLITEAIRSNMVK